MMRSFPPRSRRTLSPTRALASLLLAAVLPLSSCDADGSTRSSATGSGGRSAAPSLRVDASLHIPAAGNLLATRDRLWVISGGMPTVTQLDPATNTVTRRVKLPHPVAYGTLAHGSLWLVSYGDNVLIELDSESGRILRTLGSSPVLPLNEPVGVVFAEDSLWVLNHHDSVLLQIDEQTGELIHTTTLPGDAAAVVPEVRPAAVEGVVVAALVLDDLVVLVDAIGVVVVPAAGHEGRGEQGHRPEGHVA